MAETGSKLYFVITRLEALNSMYKFSLNSYLHLFQKALKKAEKSLKSEVSSPFLDNLYLLLIWT